jgi:uncharacterized phage protein gp47/JayE
VAFTARTRSQIRDQLLGYWSAEYSARGETLLTSEGSDAYLLASQIGVIEEALDAQAVQVSRDILPDQASTAALERFGVIYGIPRPVGTYAQLTAQVEGFAPLTFYVIPANTQAAATDGTLYDVTTASVTTDAAKHATIALTAVAIGVGGNRSVGAVLTFQSAPAGLLAPMSVLSCVPAVGPATDEVYRAVLLGRLRDRPASGNRSDWRSWVTGYLGTSVPEAYVYPLLKPPAAPPGVGTPGTLGCVTVVAIGPAQGDSFENLRLVPSDDLSTRAIGMPLPHIIEYIDGDRTIAGVPTADGYQLRPVTMGPDGDNWTVETPENYNTGCELTLVLSGAFAFPWAGSMFTEPTSTNTSLVVLGDQTAKEGLSALVLPVTPDARGNYRQVTLGPSSYTAPNTTFDQSLDPVGSPANYTYVYPAPPNWNLIRLAVFAFFDSLAPGDTSPASRWPADGQDGSLYQSSLAAAVIAVPGVLSCTVDLPATSLTPIEKSIYTLSTLWVHA